MILEIAAIASSSSGSVSSKVGPVTIANDASWDDDDDDDEDEDDDDEDEDDEDELDTFGPRPGVEIVIDAMQEIGGPCVMETIAVLVARVPCGFNN